MSKEAQKKEFLKEVGDVVENKINEKLDPLGEKVDDVTNRLEKIEKLPLTKGVPAVHNSSTYKGYNLGKQLDSARRMAEKNPAMFPMLADDEKAEDFAKFFIGVIKAKKFNDYSCVEDIKSFQEKYSAKAAMQEGTASEGGYLVPDEYLFDIINLTRDKFYIINQASVVNMSTDTLRVPTEASLVSVAFTAEESAATQTEPTVGELVLNAKRLDGYGIVSNELLMDSAVDIVGMLTEQFSYAINREHDNQYLNGTGDPVSGVLTAAAGYSVTLTADDVSGISCDELSEAISLIPQGYEDGAGFMFSKNAMHYIRTVKDTQNNYIFAKPGNGVPGTIWEHPYFESSKAPTGTDAATAFGVFGNPKYFYIGRRLGATSLDLDPYGKFTTYQTQFRMVTRWAYGIGQATAFCRLITA